MPKPAEVTLPNDREVRITRSFHARRETVWDAHTKPELFQRWCLGPPGWTMPVCEMDVRIGGKYRWRWRSEDDGKEFGFYGEFLDVDAPSRLVHAESYDPGDIGGPMPSSEPAIITLELTETGGVTTIRSTIRFPSKQARDDAMSTGMTKGMEMSYEQLDGLLAKAA